jgi:hypothetical protein
MPYDFVTNEPPMTDPVRTTGISNETLDVSAYANAVMIDVAEGPDLIDVHLSLDAARDLVRNITAAIHAAALLASGEPVP